MNGRKLYIFVLVSMTLLAAFGIWAMIDGAYKWNHRPRLEPRMRIEALSGYDPSAWYDSLWALPHPDC